MIAYGVRICNAKFPDEQCSPLQNKRSDKSQFVIALQEKMVYNKRKRKTEKVLGFGSREYERIEVE